jgi:hypothetical protein
MRQQGAGVALPQSQFRANWHVYCHNDGLEAATFCPSHVGNSHTPFHADVQLEEFDKV